MKEAGVYMSAEKIIEKILADAEIEAAEIIREAEQEAIERKRKASEQTKLRIAEVKKHADEDSAEIERRRMLTASLDSRKNSLASRRKLLDRAFDDAAKKLNEISDSEYADIITKMVAIASVTGTERLIVPVGDEKKYKGEKSLFSSLNAALKAVGKPGSLVFGGTSSKLDSGVLLSGEITDVDCSFKTLITRFREDHEMEVANILFERGV